MKLVTLVTEYDGSIVDINPEHVESLKKMSRGDGTVLTMKSGNKFILRGSIEDIKELLNK